MTPEEKTYINHLLDSNGADLEDEARDLFVRLQAAKAEGDAAAHGAARLRDEAANLEVSVINRQGRFDALSELLVASRITDVPLKDPGPGPESPEDPTHETEPAPEPTEDRTED
jgi:hypothetical protein